MTTSLLAFFVVTFMSSTALPPQQAHLYQIILIICIILTLGIALMIISLQKFYNRHHQHEIKYIK